MGVSRRRSTDQDVVDVASRGRDEGAAMGDCGGDERVILVWNSRPSDGGKCSEEPGRVRTQRSLQSGHRGPSVGELARCVFGVDVEAGCPGLIPELTEGYYGGRPGPGDSRAGCPPGPERVPARKVGQRQKSAEYERGARRRSSGAIGPSCASSAWRGRRWSRSVQWERCKGK